MESRGIGESDSSQVEDGRNRVCREGQVDAEGRENVRRAGRGAGSAIPVLDHRNADAGADDGGHRGNIDGAEPVPSGADDVEGHGVDRQRDSVVKDRVTKPDDLVHGLAFCTQRDQKTGQLCRSRLPEHDLLHAPGRVGNAEVLPRKQRVENVWPGLFFKHETILARSEDGPDFAPEGAFVAIK